MRLTHKVLFSISFLLLFLPQASPAVQPAIPDRPPRYVVDLAGIIQDETEERLNGYLQELEQKTTAQMVILTVSTLEGEPIEDFSIHVAHNVWRLGQAGKDNGVLLLVAVADRKYRFDIGYGLEGTLPDSRVGSIGRDYLVPYFRQGDYATGITMASLAVISVIAEDAGVKISGMPRVRPSPSPADRGTRGKPSIAGVILSLVFFIGLIYLFIRHPRLLLFLFMMNMMGGGRRSGWSGGGGFGGGGFGGGGGGGFGGGGASGGW